MRKNSLFVYPNDDSGDIFLNVLHFIGQKWFNLCLIGLIMYVLHNDGSLFTRAEHVKKINYTKEANESSLAQTIAFKEKPFDENAVTKFDIQNFDAKTEKKLNLANTFSNLVFVLNPDKAKEENVPQVIVEEKWNNCTAYIQRNAQIAVNEMKTFGIPASITLAQGLLESDAGDSRLAKKTNNHFGMKCFSRHCKKGHCTNFTDDTHKDFFLNFKDASLSFRAHSNLLKKKHYNDLYSYSKYDYKAWAYGLKKAGYATDKYYAEKLIRIIETFKLYGFDK